MSIDFMRALRGAAACALAVLAASLAGCGERAADASFPPLALTVSAADATSSIDVGQTASATFTIAIRARRRSTRCSSRSSAMASAA